MNALEVYTKPREETLAPTPEEVSTAPVVWRTESDEQETEFLPRVRLVQPQSDILSDENATVRAGDWYSDELGSLGRRFRLVPLAYNKERRLKEDPNLFDSDIICYSPDGIVGEGDPAGECNACPMSKWQLNPTTGRQWKPCVETYTLLAYLPDHYEQVQISFSKSAVKAFKTIEGQIRRQALRNARPQSEFWGTFSLEMTSEKGKGKFNYWTPKPLMDTSEPYTD